MIKNFFLLSVFCFAFLFGSAQQEQENENKSKLSPIINNTEICGQYFLAHESDFVDDLNQFKLKRGYFTVKTKMNDMFSVRFTQDITLDTEGDDKGNIETRLKYLYLAMQPAKSGFFKHSTIEFGMIHRPWMDFEQDINLYRAQGKMYAERYKILNSADFGIGISGLLGEKMDKDYRKNVDKDNAGKYGSYAFGLYNGPGYNDLELNNNKVMEGRLTLRPLPDFVPGLQFSYAFAYGKANIPHNNADFNMNVFYVSEQTRYFTFAGQYLTGKGSSFGTFYMPAFDDSYNTEGYSLFTEFKIPQTNFALFGRYDYFKKYHQSKNTEKYNTVVGGIAYRFLNNKLILSYDYSEHPYANSQKLLECIVEVKF
ncbi:MAG: hypothetical protein K9J21_10405 [Bacteroidales bacterium]|nr:hypothetical protein [Bacteroidales bacterium]